MSVKSKFKSVWLFYVEGFKNMTWGKQLWFLIFLKVIVLFLVLRLFFFKPILSGKDETEKIEHVGIELTNHIDE